MKKGDFVFYAVPDPQEGQPNNLLTVVLEVDQAHNACRIPLPTAPAYVHQKFCTVLPVHQGSPIMVSTAFFSSPL